MDICSDTSTSFCCQHNISGKKGETPALAIEEKFKQDASSFLIVPVLEAMDSGSTPTAHRHNQLDVQDKNFDSSVSHDGLLEKLSFIKCTSCDKSVALIICGEYHTFDELLNAKNKPDGWSKAQSEGDRIALFVLNQIIYREYEVPDEDELQVEYAFPHESDFTKLLWVKGNAVGFYSVKPKGTLDVESMDWYKMAVLDTLFIRNSLRRNGYALSAIKDILLEFPDQDVGFSTPVSRPMMQVLKKHLMSHPADRMKLWEVDGCGSEGNCQILWFLFKRR